MICLTDGQKKCYYTVGIEGVVYASVQSSTIQNGPIAAQDNDEVLK